MVSLLLLILSPLFLLSSLFLSPPLILSFLVLSPPFTMLAIPSLPSSGLTEFSLSSAFVSTWRLPFCLVSPSSLFCTFSSRPALLIG